MPGERRGFLPPVSSEGMDRFRRSSRERLRVQGDQGDEEPKSKEDQQAELLEGAREEWWAFFETHREFIKGYAGTSDLEFTVKPGGWYVKLEGKPVVNADPEFFIGKGFTKSEALFAVCHELEHFLDAADRRKKDPVAQANYQAYETLWKRIRRQTDVHNYYPKALFRMYNCLEDVLVNKKVMSKWKASRRSKDSLYPKLFPKKDMRSHPRHRQFMYTLLREAMMPQENCDIEPEVRAAIDQMNTRGGRAGFVAANTAVDRRGKARYSAQTRNQNVYSIVEPVFKELFLWDLENWKPPKNDEKGQGQGDGEGEPQPQDPDDPFGPDENENAIPDPIDLEELEEMMKKINKHIDDQAEDEFKRVMGVERVDFEYYQEDAKEVEPYIDDLREVFKRIIDRRKTYRRKLRKRTKEGPALNPSRLAQAVAEMETGNLEPEMMLDYREEEVVRTRPSKFEVTIVLDGSGSISTTAARKRVERKLAVLAMEGLRAFQEEIDREKRRGTKINLEVSSEVRMFNDEDTVLKPLSPELDHKNRVQVHKGIRNMKGGANNEPATFIAMEREQFVEPRLSELQKGETKKLIIFLTDGETNSTAVQAHMRHLYAKAGGVDNNSLVIAGIGFADGRSAVETYAPNGHYAEALGQAPEIFGKIVSEVAEDL